MITDEHRKLARELDRVEDEDTIEAWARMLADFERKVRLEEAKWFHELWESYDEKGNHKYPFPLTTDGEQMCRMCKHIAALSQSGSAKAGETEK